MRPLKPAVVAENPIENTWTLRESDDEYQSANYCGGYDAYEKAFCFSRYHPNGTEYWFQFTLKQAIGINAGALTELPARTTKKNIPNNYYY